MPSVVTDTDFMGAVGATLLINRLTGDEEFGGRLEHALSHDDLNDVSELLSQVGADSSVFSLTTREDDEGVKATTINIKCKKCTITIESND